ncbi:PAS domain S-box protein [Paucidesulfovibrio longus]|uniref:PAS domain S-box protein n=1 Tax=Paucidesulfovibrio longus TaxID=889 RepID=UPI0003B3FE70|nr:PAS domain S-box protein [Paucidesulfovibrio longus]
MILKSLGIRWRLVALTVLTLIPVFAAGLGLTTYFVYRGQDLEMRKSEEALVQAAQAYLQGRMEMARLDTIFLANSPYVQTLFEKHAWGGGTGETESLDALLSGFMESKRIYAQLRILDATGWERYRLDYKNGRVERLPQDRLQFKRNRYYFQEAMLTPPGSVYVSRLDLNREQGKVELPATSMLRFIAPVQRPTGETGGLFVLNYTGDWLLSDLVQSMPHRSGFWVVVKDDGSYVYHDRDPGRNWGGPDSLDTGMSLFRDFPEEASLLLRGETATVRFNEGEWLATPLNVSLGRPDETLTLVHISERPSPAAAFRNISWLVFLVPVGAFLGGLTIALYGGAAVSRPLLSLKKAMSGFASGNRKLRSNVRSSDEIGVLSDIFNDMAERLEMLYENLEDQVRSRTEELEWTNSRLARSEAVNAAIIDNTLEGIISADLQGRIIGFNKAAERIFGYSAGEAIGQPLSILQPSPHSEEHAKYIERYLRTGGPHIIGKGRELIGMHKDGSTFPVQLGISDVTVGDQRFFTAVLRDMTEIRNTQQELVWSEMRFRATFEQAAVGIAHVGLDGSWLLFNDRLCSIVGYSREELMGRTFQDITHPDDLEKDLELVGKVLSGEIDNYSMEKRYVGKQGEIVWVNLTVSLLRDDDGKPVHFISVLEDISERKRMDETLRRTRLSIDRSGEGIYWVRPDGTFFDVNEGAARLLGIPREELLRMGLWDLDPDFNLQSWPERFQEHRSLGGMRFEARHRRAGGTLIPVEVVTYYQEFDGEPFLCCFVSDIGQRKDAEQKLIRAKDEAEQARQTAEAASQAKSNFLASMSHELRTPLNAIIGFAEVMQDKYFGPLTAKQEEYVGDILQSGHHLLSLINDILELSKIEAGKMELLPSRFDLDMLLSTSLIYIREKASRHGIDLRLDLRPDLGLINADERKIKQVVFNLLSNASKFTPDGGSIVLSARRLSADEAKGMVPEPLRGGLSDDDGDWLEVAVTDSGIGLKEPDLRKVFEEFYQVSAGRTGKTPGTGLGLPLSAQLLALHGGAIWAESRGEGQGSRFTFVLPADAWQGKG